MFVYECHGPCQIIIMYNTSLLSRRTNFKWSTDDIIPRLKPMNVRTSRAVCEQKGRQIILSHVEQRILERFVHPAL